ncbi:hypothetical protein Tco_1553509 [Tanacetum coccineum]
MSVHREYGDGFVNEFIDDPVTLIGRLDMSNHLHLHPNDSTTLTVVSIKLKGTENHQLNALWKQCHAMIELPRCTCHTADDFKKHNQLMKLMQFLIGLDDSYMQIRSSILSREALPDVRSASATISSEKSHIVASGSIFGSSQRNQAFAFVSNVPNRGNFQRNQPSNNAPRLNNVNNNKQNGSSGLVCENCGFNGHTIDRCFKIIGYPADFGKKKFGQNVKGKSKMISNGKIVDSWANQPMTNTDMELDNVYDISYLKLKVGHPNGTEAFISKIENLKLPNGLVLFDVLVVPKYCVTLISVHKLAKEDFFNNHNKLDSRSEKSIIMGYSNYKKGYRLYSLDKHRFIFSRDVKFFESVFPFKDSVSKKVDTSNVFQDLNHINFFDDDYPKMPNGDERVDPNLNTVYRSQSDSSHSSILGGGVDTADFPSNNSGNDADNSDDIFVAHDDGVVKTVKVDSANQIADILTKGLDTLQHKVLVEKLEEILDGVVKTVKVDSANQIADILVQVMFVDCWIVGGALLLSVDSHMLGQGL